MRLGERTLSLQDPPLEGPDVSAWQRIIQTHPILGTVRLQESGVFDELTDAVTRRWQGEHGVTVDGIVGAVTLLEAWATLGPPNPEHPLPPRDDVEDILAQRRAAAEKRTQGANK